MTTFTLRNPWNDESRDEWCHLIGLSGQIGGSGLHPGDRIVIGDLHDRGDREYGHYRL